MTQEELQNIVETGRAAEEFLAYTYEVPYFRELLDRIKVTKLQNIGDLSPRDTELFSTLKAQYDFADEIENAILGDIHAAANALKKLAGEEDPDPGGIL